MNNNVEQINLTNEALIKNKDFYIVGIGASAGGLDALEQFFINMPVVDNIAFVVIQHLSPDFKSLMPEILSRNTNMKVQQIQNGMEITPGCIYLNPPKYSVIINQRQFFLYEQNPLYRINLIINVFFETLAKEMNEKAIAIILSGTGSDGTRGCRVVKEAGGLVLSQDLKSAKFTGMPRSVINSNICDIISPPAQMPEKILKYTGVVPAIEMDNKEESSEIATAPDPLTDIFRLLEDRYYIDFSQYKQNTVLRCLNRRMRIRQISKPESYVLYLKDNSEEADYLYNSLLIGVTGFFRDSAAFEAIKSKVIPEIVNSNTHETIRVWVAGCSTGEEAYSLAILFKDYMDTAKKNVSVKIFATDIDNKAIEYASQGIYPDSIADDVPIEFLNRYFIKKRDGYHIVKFIREMVIFSHHNVLNNPPFYKVNLLSCRNMLIYFQPELQKKVMSAFQFALDIKGFLFLGTSETTGDLSDYFTAIDIKWKIYKKKDIKKQFPIDDLMFTSSKFKVVNTKSNYDKFMQPERSRKDMEEIYPILIEECLPPCVVVDDNGGLIQIIGNAGRYLKLPKGRVSYNIQKLVPNELSTAVSTAVSKVIKEKKPVIYTNLKATVSGEIINMNLTVRPLVIKNEGILVCIMFQEAKSIEIKDDYVETFDTVAELQNRIIDLEQELQYTKENLQTTIEEMETTSEELRSANEELLVSNEELHSTNEELQSVNEELIVVNNQYQYKIQELADLNNDMLNFLNSTTIGTVFLDSDLCVRKFTVAVTKEINLMEQDIGRPISHISHNFIDENPANDARTVMDTLIPIEKEIQSINKKWYLIKYSPFRTSENVIKGVVISLVDITARKNAEEKQKISNEQLKEAMALDILKSEFFSNLSHELRTPLNVIMSTLQLLDIESKRDGVASAVKQKKLLGIMKQNCYRQLRLVNNIIDSTKIDSGFFEINMQNHNIISVIENIVSSVHIYIENKGLKIIFDTDIEEKIIACDLDGIERIILNLLSNAVKFTQRGGRIDVKITDNGKSIIISIKDTGIGIPKDKQKIIFDRFRQVDKSLTRNYEGSGIGLSLVKKLVELHDGVIKVQSEYGYGTEFVIELPVKQIPENDTIINKNKHESNNENVFIEFSDIYNMTSLQ